jgi:hypothetical protein
MEKRGINPNAKKAQMQIGFGVIFSIILIVIFIAFAIYAIGKFMSIRTMAQIEKFKSDFQGDIDRMWKSTSGSTEVQYYLPNKVKQICFVDNEDENIYFSPPDFKGGILKNVDFTKTLASSRTNPKTLCINTVGGKVSMTIKKSYNEALVTITK